MASTLAKSRPSKKSSRPLSYGKVSQLHQEGPVLLTVAPKKFAKVCYDTLLKWVTYGLSLDGQQRVRLEFLTIGGRLHTTEAAYVRFLEKTNSEK